MSAHKATIQQSNEHALSPVELRKEGGDSYSLGSDTSRLRSRTCSPRKEKIEALRDLRIGPLLVEQRICQAQGVNRATNLSNSKANSMLK